MVLGAVSFSNIFSQTVYVRAIAAVQIFQKHSYMAGVGAWGSAGDTFTSFFLTVALFTSVQAAPGDIVNLRPNLHDFRVTGQFLALV